MENYSLIEAKEFMERINMWFYRGQTNIYNIQTLQQLALNLYKAVDRPSVSGGNLQIAGDILQMLLTQMDGFQVEPIKLVLPLPDRTFGMNDDMKNDSKYRSLDTLAGNFMSIETAGAMVVSGPNQSLSASTPDLFRCREGEYPAIQTPVTTPLTSQNYTLKNPSPSVILLNNVTPSNLTPPSEGPPPLKREMTWDIETRSSKNPSLTSSPVTNLTSSLGSLTLEKEEKILKMLKEAQNKVKGAVEILECPLDKTWKIENEKIAKAECAPKPLKRGARHSLGGGALPLPRRALLSTVMDTSANRPKTPQLASKQTPSLITARRRLTQVSPLASTSPRSPITNSGLKPKSSPRLPPSPFTTATARSKFASSSVPKKKV